MPNPNEFAKHVIDKRRGQPGNRARTVPPGRVGNIMSRTRLRLISGGIFLATLLAGGGMAYENCQDNEQEESAAAEVVNRDQAELTLDARYDFMKRVSSMGFTPDEDGIRTGVEVQQGSQEALLDDLLDEALGPNFSRINYMRDRSGYMRQQKAWLDAQIKSGAIIKLEDRPENGAYFCEQVGMSSGYGNNKEMMYMSVDFEPVLEELVRLINYQIDLFNQNPALYGYPEFTGVTIPHISRIKIAGAYRTLQHQYEGGLPGATGSRSSHLVAHALDLVPIGGQNEDSYMVEFSEPLIITGQEVIPSGGRLPADSSGGNLRIIMSQMVGHALLTMRETMSSDFTIMPLYEHTAGDGSGIMGYHVVVRKK